MRSTPTWDYSDDSLELSRIWNRLKVTVLMELFTAAERKGKTRNIVDDTDCTLDQLVFKQIT